MCDRYSYNYGYICNDCFDELSGVRVYDVQEFMDTAAFKVSPMHSFWIDAINDEFMEDS